MHEVIFNFDQPKLFVRDLPLIWFLFSGALPIGPPKVSIVLKYIFGLSQTYQICLPITGWPMPQYISLIHSFRKLNIIAFVPFFLEL